MLTVPAVPKSFDWTTVRNFVSEHPPAALTSIGDTSLRQVPLTLRQAGNLVNDCLFAIGSGLNVPPEFARWAHFDASSSSGARALHEQLSAFGRAQLVNFEILDEAEVALVALSGWVQAWNEQIEPLDRSEPALESLTAAQRQILTSIVVSISDLTRLIETSLELIRQRQTLELVRLDATAKISAAIGYTAGTTILSAASAEDLDRRALISDALERLTGGAL